MSVTPWTPEKRKKVNDEIAKQAEKVAKRIGCRGVVIIAFFPDGNNMHVEEAGRAPMPFKELHQKMTTAYEVLEASGGEDVAVN